MSHGYRAVETGIAETVAMLQFDLQLEGLEGLSERQVEHLRAFATRVVSYTMEHCARIVEETPYGPDEQMWPAMVSRETAVDAMAMQIRSDKQMYKALGLPVKESVGESMMLE